MISERHERHRFLATLSPWFIALTVVCYSARAQERPARGTVSGKVVDPDGEPIAGARVWTDKLDFRPTGRPETFLEARTDAKGRFQLGPAAPVYRHDPVVKIEADGFAVSALPAETLSIFPGRDNNLGTIRLERGRVFTGQVLDANRDPVANVSVRAHVYQRTAGSTGNGVGPSRPSKTDAQGRFRTAPLPVGLLCVSLEGADGELVSVEFGSRTVLPGGEEDLGTIPLQAEVPVTGILRDEVGQPVADAAVFCRKKVLTDEAGRFRVHILAAEPNHISVTKVGYARVVGVLTVSDAGVVCKYRQRGEPKETAPAKELTLTVPRVGLIEGEAIDEDTGDPVPLDRVTVSGPVRKNNGELGTGSWSRFEQPEPGHFRADFFEPGEFQLRFGAAGYLDAQAHTPKVTELATITGISVRMKKTNANVPPPVVLPPIPAQTIKGRVTRDGRPVEGGWAALWRPGRPRDAINATLMRGRTVDTEPAVFQSIPITDGKYSLGVPSPGENWYVVVEEPGHSLTQVGPITVAPNQAQTLDIACTEGSRMRGHVAGVPSTWAGHFWVVAFSKSGVRAEARIDAQGEFSLPPLPAGEYGLKVGHDGYKDPEILRDGAYLALPKGPIGPADPWKQAKRVTLEADRDVEGVVLTPPQ